MAWYEKWAIMVTAAAIGLAGYEGIPWRKMGVAEWAYWVAAIGTVGALAGTIWIATRAEAMRRKNALSLATLTAIGLAVDISAKTTILKNAIQLFKGDQCPNLTLREKIAKRLDVAGGWDMNEFIPLMIIDGRPAEHLASAQALLSKIPIWLRRDEIKVAPGDYSNNMLSALKEAFSHLTAANEALENHVRVELAD